MRVVLFTGKGGAGKTTLSAATAALVAEQGHRTLVVSTDAAHSLADVVDAPLGSEPTEIDSHLYGMHVDTQSGFERSWAQIQSYLFELLAAGGVSPVDAAELVVVPGAEEVLVLLAVRDAAVSGHFDVICVDCAPTAETLRLLRLPDLLAWWMRRLYPDDHRVLRTLRPVLSRAGGLPFPAAGVFEAIDRLHAQLADVRTLLTGPDVCGVRLVTTPERVVVAEARRTLTALSLHGYRVDGVLTNRVLPAGQDDWRSGWVRAQQRQLAEIDASFGGLPRWRVPYGPAEPIGIPALRELARDSYGADDPLAMPGAAAEPLAVTQDDDGFVLSLALPFVARGEVDLVRNGDDLVVSVGAARRVVSLPSALRRCVVGSARLADGALRIRFTPDPKLWPKS